MDFESIIVAGGGNLIFQDAGGVGPAPRLVFSRSSGLTDTDVLLNRWKTS